ncbi:MAG TPA: DNA polymerase III subunit gamma/tau, partial [Tenericutes bacterium]|nr:DNA polymerase III subunit gamma/tau [Mycoplasmatota bacterium]
MYQALYRKYRPTNLDDVYGQNIIVQILKNSITNNKVSHAYLFSGPRGTGKTSVAKIVGKILNCTNLKEYVPCETCESCIQFNEKNSIDIIEIDAASNNGVDEIRELKSKINLVPSIGKYKIYIIDEVHMLSIGAFNALLKTLEEPPAHVIFIMATTDPHKVPTTILSRCQKLEFKKININDIASRIRYISETENITIDNDSIYEIAKHSNGGMRDAISMLDQLLAYTNNNINKKAVYEINGLIEEEKLENLIIAIFEKDLQTILNLIEEYDNQGKSLLKLSEELIIRLKDILLYKILNKNDVEKKHSYISKNIDKIDNNLILTIIEELN